MATFSDAERTRSIQFIGKLMQACRGHDRELDSRLAKLKQTVIENGNVFAVLVDAVKYCSLGQITTALYDVGGQYRRSM